jgi:hypothetical protein
MSYIGTQPTAGSYRKLTDISSGFNGSTTTFQLSVPPGTSSDYVTPLSTYQLLISVNSIVLNPGVDFTLSGSQIVFTVAPAAGVKFFGIVMGDALSIGAPSDGTITTSKFISNLTVPLGAGTAAAPSLTFTGNSTTGIYSPATNIFAISTNGTERLRIDNNVGIGLAGSTATAYLHLAAGGTAAGTSPLKINSGSLLTVPEVGTTEYDGNAFYHTSSATTGRGQAIARQVFRLTAAGSALGPTIADYFGATSSINLAATNVYEIEYFLYFTKTTAGTVTFTLTASSAPTGIFGTLIGSPATGVGSGAPQTGYTASQGATTAAFPATASLTTAVNHAYTIRSQIITNAATTFKVQVTSSAGTVTPLAGSFYCVRRVATTTGNFS